MYQKMISYMYEYVNGEKGNNIGFAKIAVQNQRYKIKVHIKNFALNGRVLKVYGFVRGDGILYSSCLGSIKLKNGIGEGLFAGNTGDLWEKYRFLDMSGLILCGNSLVGTQENNENPDEKTALLQQEKARFCATQWEEGTIVLEQLDIFQGQTNGNVRKVESESRIGQKAETDVKSQAVAKIENARRFGQKTDTEVESQLVLKTESERRLGQNVSTEMENQAVMESENGRKILQAAETGAQYQMGVADNKRNQELQMIDSSKYQIDNQKSRVSQLVENPSSCQVQMSGGKAEQQPVKEQAKQPPEAEQESSLLNQESNQAEEDIWDLFEQRRKQIQLQFEEIKRGTGNERKDQINEKVKDETKWQPGEEILEKFPEMCPFFDNSVSASVRIEPKDIGALPMEFWYLANNSFLLHGYYCYRHLLFMKMDVGQEMVYAIAVPGNSNYREKFMANMFGFEQFKTVQKKENAGFGYWWKRIF